jgi:hypothetical protein
VIADGHLPQPLDGEIIAHGMGENGDRADVLVVDKSPKDGFKRVARIHGAVAIIDIVDDAPA